MSKKMLCCLLALILVFVSGGIQFALPVGAEPAINEEAKIYSTATLEDDFTDD